MSNPFLHLDYEPAFEALGGDYSDIVTAAEFPMHQLRFRNNSVLTQLGLNPETVTDEHFIEAFGKFESVRPLSSCVTTAISLGNITPIWVTDGGFCTAKREE